MLARVVLVAFSLTFLTHPGPALAEPIYGLTTDNRIFAFDSSTPNSISALLPVTGLPAGTTLMGLDFRPATPGVLVGVGQNAAGGGAVFTIDRFSGNATQINGIATLTGTAFGVDFNPVPGALRIVSNADQNLRITAGGAGVVNTDGALNPGNPNIVGAAYSNNVPGGVGGQTTLYDIDSALDRLFTQGTVNFPPGTSPNTGTLFEVGDLGVDTTDLVGFDISGRTGLAFASLTPEDADGSSLYLINLGTGTATLVGAIDDSLFVRDISVANVVPLPASLALVAAGVVAMGTLRRAGRPAMRRPIRRDVSSAPA
jgi:Domain of unknown function (DUF4394)